MRAVVFLFFRVKRYKSEASTFVYVTHCMGMMKYGINKASLLCVAAAAVTFSTNAAAQISLSHISLFSSLSVCQKCHFGFICGWVLLWMNTIYVPEQSKRWYKHQHSHCEWPCKRLKHEPILIDAYFCASENAFCIAVGMAQVRTENQEWISREFSSVLHIMTVLLQFLCHHHFSYFQYKAGAWAVSKQCVMCIGFQYKMSEYILKGGMLFHRAEPLMYFTAVKLTWTYDIYSLIKSISSYTYLRFDRT